MVALLVALTLCLSVTVDDVTLGMARIELGACGVVTVWAPWAREGWSTAPGRALQLEERRRAIPLAPSGDLAL